VAKKRKTEPEERVTTTEVEIFGASYSIRGTQDPETLRELAAEVDRKMREIAAHAPSIDVGRLAILAALNLAEEASRNRRQVDEERGVIETKVAELTEELAAALVS